MKRIVCCLLALVLVGLFCVPASAQPGKTLLVPPFKINQIYLDPLKRKAHVSLCLKALVKVLNEQNPFGAIVSCYELDGLEGITPTYIPKDSVDKSRVWMRGRFNKDVPNTEQVLKLAQREKADAVVMFSVFEGRTKWLVRVHLISVATQKTYYRASKQVRKLKTLHAVAIMEDVLEKYFKSEP